MQVIYVVIGLGKKKVSISEKIFSQIQELNNLGVSTTGFFYSKEVAQKENINEHIICFPLKENRIRKYFNPFYQAQDNVLQALEILKKELPLQY